MYNPTTYTEPFWAENSGFMTGRDALGIQNSSITVYSKLLPGLTNLTQRLRYYGLYCWLLKEYEKNTLKSENRTLEGQYNFVRRAELIVAYLMVNTASDQLSVIGSDFAKKHLAEIETLGFYNIKEGADKHVNTPKGTVYWDFVSGALGQYYAGSLVALELIKTSEKFFELIKERGLLMAEAIESAIDKPTRDIFLAAIDSGRLSMVDIQKLQGFALQNIRENTDEWNSYKELLVGADGFNYQTTDKKPTTNRKESIRLYLEYIIDSQKEYEFVPYQYYLRENGLENCNANFGWYYYYINESYHFAIETIFWVFLSELEGNSIPIQVFLNRITDLALSQLNVQFIIKPDQTLESVLNLLPNESLIETLNKLEGLTKSKSNKEEALGMAFTVLFQTYLNTQSRQEEISNFEILNRITDQNGHVSENARNFIARYLTTDLKNYVHEVVKNILNNHITTAYRKMGNGESNLLKFLIEDNLIMHIQTMSPNHTTPRINTLRNFMLDLKLITSDYKITTSGTDLLKTLKEENAG